MTHLLSSAVNPRSSYIARAASNSTGGVESMSRIIMIMARRIRPMVFRMLAKSIMITPQMMKVV